MSKLVGISPSIEVSEYVIGKPDGVVPTCAKCGRVEDPVLGATSLMHFTKTKPYMFEELTYDWFNKGLPRDIGPCRGCHDVEVDKIMQLINFLVKLEVLR